MADITAKMVNDLRNKTGLGMMECKKALTETSGDIEKAIEYFRKKGVKASITERAASEGRVAVADCRRPQTRRHRRNQLQHGFRRQERNRRQTGGHRRRKIPGQSIRQACRRPGHQGPTGQHLSADRRKCDDRPIRRALHQRRRHRQLSLHGRRQGQERGADRASRPRRRTICSATSACTSSPPVRSP